LRLFGHTPPESGRSVGECFDMIDLHTHTLASDGTSSPEVLVAEAVRAGVEVLAVTDHDTLAATEAARQAADAAGIRLIAGVEISTSLCDSMRDVYQASPRDIHLLAYFPTGRIPDDFRTWLRTLESSRWERNRELLASLATHDIFIDEADLRERGGSIAGRVHMARILCERGQVRSIDEAFRRYLGEDASSYVPRRSPPISQVIQHIRLAGGIASLAHPTRFWGDNWQAADAICQRLADVGLDAVEVWHSEQDPAYSGLLADLAVRHALRMTGGSDFHGGNKPGITLGRGYGDRALVPVDLLRNSWQDAALPLV
jgi:3',5'-nucleoside bisphosphate phosphatase